MLRKNSDSLDQDDFIKKIIRHKFSKINRPNSQLTKTSKVKSKPVLMSLNPSKKSSPLNSPKPKSTKSVVFTPNNIEDISKKTSQDIIRSIYLLVSSKLPSSFESSELTEKDQEEIQDFFIKQKEKFKKTLQNLSSKNREKKKKTSSQSKSLKILEDKYLKEIKRMKEKKNIVRKELLKKTSERIIKEKEAVKKKKEIEFKKKRNEEKKIQGQEKDLIIMNIENYYKDKVNLVKEYFKNEDEKAKVLSLEERRITSDGNREIRMNSCKKFSSLKDKIEVEIERMKEKFDSLH